MRSNDPLVFLSCQALFNPNVESCPKIHEPKQAKIAQYLLPLSNGKLFPNQLPDFQGAIARNSGSCSPKFGELSFTLHRAPLHSLQINGHSTSRAYAYERARGATFGRHPRLAYGVSEERADTSSVEIRSRSQKRS